MEINLLPKNSPLVEYRFSIITLPLLIIIALATFGVVRYLQIESQTALLQSQLAQTRSENVVMKAQRTLDSHSKLLVQIQSAVQNIQVNERDYGTMLDGIAAKLSDKTRVTSAIMDANSQTVTLLLQSDSIDNIADYAVLLRAEPWVKNVFIDNIQNDIADTGDSTAATSGANGLAGVSTSNSALKTTGAAQSTDILTKLRKQIPFSTKVVITLAPNGISQK